MVKVGSGKKQVNQYDKILRENMEAALPGLIKDLLCIEAVRTEEIPGDVQHTKERKPDVLKKVIDNNGETFALHIEFQVKDEPNMIFRMAEYWVMLYRKYKLPVKQYVIYVGKGVPNMADHIRSGRIYFHYELIALSTVDYQLLLRSDKPEEKMMAILAGFGKENPTAVVKEIVSQVIQTTTGDLDKQRFLQQLRILGQLRNLDLDIVKIMDSIAEFISEERDILYQWGMIKGEIKGESKGEIKGEEKAKTAVVKNLLRTAKFTDSEIASLAEVPEAFVEKIKGTLS